MITIKLTTSSGVVDWLSIDTGDRVESVVQQEIIDLLLENFELTDAQYSEDPEPLTAAELL
jgi:hypothetical protein